MPNSDNSADIAGVQCAMQAQLGERVTNLGRRQTDLETEMRTGFKQMESSSTLSRRRDAQFGFSIGICEHG